MIEALQVNHKNLGKAVDRQIFLDVDFLLAAGALVSTVYHPLHVHKLLEAVSDVDIACEPNRFFGDLYRQVHEVIKGHSLVSTRLADETAH